MNLTHIPAGKKLPEDIYIIIEIPAETRFVKYEIERQSGVLFVDRFIPAAMFYPCNYGYINRTLSLDGDPIDALIPTPYPLHIGAVVRARPIGVLKMTDESGTDTKVLAVPHTQLSKEYDHIQDICDLTDSIKEKIAHFFHHYKDLELKKWIRVDGWGNVKDAEIEILDSFERANKK